MSSETDHIAWERLKKKYTTYELAAKILKLPSYKRYHDKYKYDDLDSDLSLELLEEQGYIIANDDVAIIETIMSEEWIRDFYQILTPKQRYVADLLARGYSTTEIHKLAGYRNTGGVRYHKLVIRKTFKERTDNDS